ncbi:hypothetical protein [Lysinibacillus fusiformis]|uniref:hypothetical protein n=1 Tax=Lysinibacillus fusiformis TaxID=28031 RepID=UPI000D349563|nr:hypothetical protein [Lysinibacillus fusiformis]MED4672381.1 hypothetical protein [Lysinibacillus fusiformis]RDV32224.1 hypothetical protein C7B90_10895 [Lysinibacillus fusiformis]GED65577.1 hypothetical protein LFU01_40290 [Lysinibacillus fusiformis]
MATKAQKSNKQIAEMILRVQGQDYDEWLDEQHVALITRSTEVITKVTKMALTKDIPGNSSNQLNQQSEPVDS